MTWIWTIMMNKIYAKQNTNTRYVYEVWSPRPTSPLLTSRRYPLSQSGLEAGTSTHSVCKITENSHTTQTLCNHTLHTKCRNLPRVLLLKCSITTSPRFVNRRHSYWIRPRVSPHTSLGVQVYYKWFSQIKVKYNDLFSNNKWEHNEAHTH